MKLGIKTFFATVAIGAMAFASTSSAAVLSYDFTTSGEYTGSGSGLSGTARATFDDGDSAGSVRLTVDLTDWDTNLSEYVAGFYFNTDVTALLTQIIVDPSSDTSLNFGTDSFSTGGQGGAFDALAGFETSNAPSGSRFVAGETFVVDMFGTGISVDTFAGNSTVSNNRQGGEYPAVLRARSLDDDGEGSGWFAGTAPSPVPVPAGLPLMLSFIGIGAYLRKRKQKAA